MDNKIFGRQHGALKGGGGSVAMDPNRGFDPDSIIDDVARQEQERADVALSGMGTLSEPDLFSGTFDGDSQKVLSQQIEGLFSDAPLSEELRVDETPVTEEVPHVEPDAAVVDLVAMMQAQEAAAIAELVEQRIKAAPQQVFFDLTGNKAADDYARDGEEASVIVKVIKPKKIKIPQTYDAAEDQRMRRVYEKAVAEKTKRQAELDASIKIIEERLAQQHRTLDLLNSELKDVKNGVHFSNNEEKYAVKREGFTSKDARSHHIRYDFASGQYITSKEDQADLRKRIGLAKAAITLSKKALKGELSKSRFANKSLVAEIAKQQAYVQAIEELKNVAQPSVASSSALQLDLFDVPTVPLNAIATDVAIKPQETVSAMPVVASPAQEDDGIIDLVVPAAVALSATEEGQIADMLDQAVGSRAEAVVSGADKDDIIDLTNRIPDEDIIDLTVPALVAAKVEKQKAAVHDPDDEIIDLTVPAPVAAKDEKQKAAVRVDAVSGGEKVVSVDPPKVAKKPGLVASAVGEKKGKDQNSRELPPAQIVRLGGGASGPDKPPVSGGGTIYKYDFSKLRSPSEQYDFICPESSALSLLTGVFARAGRALVSRPAKIAATFIAVISAALVMSQTQVGKSWGRAASSVTGSSFVASAVSVIKNFNLAAKDTLLIATSGNKVGCDSESSSTEHSSPRKEWGVASPGWIVSKSKPVNLYRHPDVGGGAEITNLPGTRMRALNVSQDGWVKVDNHGIIYYIQNTLDLKKDEPTRTVNVNGKFVTQRDVR